MDSTDTRDRSGEHYRETTPQDHTEGEDELYDIDHEIAEEIAEHVIEIVSAVVDRAARAWMLKVAWNRTLPELFGTKPLTFWQANGILAIASLLTAPPRESDL